MSELNYAQNRITRDAEAQAISDGGAHVFSSIKIWETVNIATTDHVAVLTLDLTHTFYSMF